MATLKSLPKIAIIGAGPAGLTLAALLHKSRALDSSPFTIFDLRSAPSASALQTPSGSLDLHPGTGQLAIEKCGLTSKFKTMISDCSEQTIVADKSGKIWYQDNNQTGDRPEISRNALTYLLLSSLPPDLIRWNTKVLSVTPGAERKWKVTFGNKQQDEFDEIVGADGAWSKARDAIPGASKPFYSGASYLTFTIRNLSTNYHSLDSLLGNGSYSAFSEHKAVISQRGAMGSARLYLMMSIASPSYFSDSGLDSLPRAELKRKLLGEEDFFQGWGGGLKELIAAGCDAAEDKMEARPLYMHPIGDSWTHTPGITLIGDAAHLMTPSGEGVNCAMLDALELSEAIISSLETEGGLDEAVKAFEEKMWKRSKELTEDADRMKKIMLEDKNAPEQFCQMFEGAQGAHAQEE
ncbi:Monooxygenase asqM [Lachnellula cervina]|uniref:Monooxygenase asqM n=1 Tax=Lachnellula cervina TaxID=1316786 RepID=A0A7D8YG62_9HELO|nr:Monooxygenase asqM [Lachnellula cervina]